MPCPRSKAASIAPLATSRSNFARSHPRGGAAHAGIGRTSGDEPRSADGDEWSWARGEAELLMRRIPSGRGSPYLPKVYEELYNRDW